MSYSDYGITPEQYHAALDKLWKALRITTHQEKDVFTLAAEAIDRYRSLTEDSVCGVEEPMQQKESFAVGDQVVICKPLSYMNGCNGKITHVLNDNKFRVCTKTGVDTYDAAHLIAIADSSIFDAMKKLQNAVASYSDYAWTWHCNLAMPIRDEGVDSKTANLAAARIMSLVFGVDVTKSSEWKSLNLEQDASPDSAQSLFDWLIASGAVLQSEPGDRLVVEAPLGLLTESVVKKIQHYKIDLIDLVSKKETRQSNQIVYLVNGTGNRYWDGELVEIVTSNESGFCLVKSRLGQTWVRGECLTAPAIA